jgi:hypothetical protein
MSRKCSRTGRARTVGAVLGYERANSPTAASNASRAAWPTEDASSARASSHGSASAASSSRAASSLNSSARGRPRVRASMSR